MKFRCRKFKINVKIYTYEVDVVKLKSTQDLVTKELIWICKQHYNLSRGVFAKYLRTNERTLENWEQCLAKPNGQATVLIHMVERYPDKVERLSAIQVTCSQIWYVVP